MGLAYLLPFFISTFIFSCITNLSQFTWLVDAHDKQIFKMGMIHRDFSNKALTTQLEKWVSSVERSNLRLEYLKEFLDAKLKGGKDEAGDDNYEAPVWSNMGSYITTMQFGTPQNKVTVIVDTGSDLVWQQCEDCISCADQKDPIFDPSKSSSYTQASCTSDLCEALPTHACLSSCMYSYAYGDNSRTTGVFVYDTITLTDTTGKEVPISQFGFGCSHVTQGDFGGTPGIMGLGRGPLSLNSQLKINKFSYCLVSFDGASTDTSSMFLGDVAQEMFDKASDIQSTSLLSNPRFDPQVYYYLRIEGISVGATRLKLPRGAFEIKGDGSGGIIIDSGTTLTYLNEGVYDVVVKAFESHIKGLQRVDGGDVGLDLCYERAGEVPTLTLHFDDTSIIDLPPQNYFVYAGQLFCLAMLNAGSDISILGNILQQNFHILYDLSQQSISFASATCDKLN